MASAESKSRLEALKTLLGRGTLSTQDELREKLKRLDFDVTQSTISRDLRKLGAIRAVDGKGQTVYRLADDPAAAPVPAASLRDLVVGIRTNGSIIAIRTSPGSASLIARHLDYALPERILGTLAGDDTVFVAPTSIKDTQKTIQAIESSLQPASGGA